MDDLKVSVGRLLENILSEVQNVKDKQDILQAQLETQTSVISNLVQQALSLSASALLQSQQYLPQSIHVVSTAIAPPQHGLPSPIQLPNQFPQIPNPTVLQRDPYLPPPVQSQEIPNQQYQLPLIQQPRPQPGALPHQQYQQTPHSQYSQPAPHLPQQQLPHSSGNPPQLQSSMGHRLEEPPYAPFQNYPPNLRHPPTLPQGYEPLSSISGASYSSGYDTLPGPAEPNRYGRPPQYGTPPQGYEPPSSRFGASYSSRYDTLSEIAEPNRYGGPPQYGGKQPQLHTASVAYISGSGYPQLPTAYILPQAIPTESSVSFGSGSPGAGNRVSVDHVVEKVATMGFPREHVRAIVRKLTENILILLFLYHLFLFL
ncbi:hypothetical protein MtrunA17_Chr6g0449551 [Medicago truncatula]|uniref:DUF1421 family protein n=1 Tax=Medicago truncatula TaxID=3880 RepID=A0A072UG90_MEDTR|nr:basic salivary proline-rich protein 1 [Medicago truncatula]XP_039682612.1 basic salivary proline-rich protein 1 [Medicago truncatula]KEH24795.1 DUF1421 family protein [Medicago truncatula]RHN49713.1 hypothetical protein MtrunA17_Chr6g0449551 [Medicago truncatula]